MDAKTHREAAPVGAEPVIPEADVPGSLGRRVLRARTLISFGIAAAIVIFLFRRLDIDPGVVWANIRQANLLFLGLGFVVYYASFAVRAFRWRRMLARAGISEEQGYAVPGPGGLSRILLLSWFANCVVPAKLGDAYRSYLLKRETRAPFSTALGTIVAERLLDLSVLFLGLVLMSGLVFGRHLPGEATQAFVFGAILIALGFAGLVALWTLRGTVERWLPHRVRQQFGRLHDAIFVCLKRPQWFIGISLVIWLGEALRVLLVAAALGTQLSLPVAVFVALMSSLLTALPITPAGLGVVETAMIALLRLVGVDETMAVSIALLDRFISYWSIIITGLPLYLYRMRKELT